MGSWRGAFVGAPYLRDVFVAMGVLSETFETAITWERFPAFHERVTDAAEQALREACGDGQVTCRFTHVYPDGPAPYYTVMGTARRGEEVEQWGAIKRAVSDAILREGGTITHHHAVGRDHRPWYDRQRPGALRGGAARGEGGGGSAGHHEPGRAGRSAAHEDRRAGTGRRGRPGGGCARARGHPQERGYARSAGAPVSAGPSRAHERGHLRERGSWPATSVSVVARESTAQVLNEQGLRVSRVSLGEFTAHPRAVARLEEPVDVLVVATKAAGLASALERVAAAPELVLPLLNGLDHVAALRERFAPATVVAGTIRVEADRPQPGVVVHSSPFLRIDMASRFPSAAAPMQALAQTLTERRHPRQVARADLRSRGGAGDVVQAGAPQRARVHHQRLR